MTRLWCVQKSSCVHRAFQSPHVQILRCSLPSVHIDFVWNLHLVSVFFCLRLYKQYKQWGHSKLCVIQFGQLFDDIKTPKIKIPYWNKSQTSV